MNIKSKRLKAIIKEEYARSLMSENLRYHVDRNVGIDKNIFRPGSREFFALFREVRSLHERGLYDLRESEREYILEHELGEFGYHDGYKVPLDFPMLEGSEFLVEAVHSGKKVELNKPKRGGDGGKAYVYVNSGKKDKKGRIKAKKVSFGSSMPDAMGKSPEHKKRRKNFGDRHQCSKKNDKTKAGYWACRATKFFGRSIAGWW
jgi:hypothetical protein